MKTKMKAVLIAGVAGLTATTMFAQSTNNAEIVQYSAKVAMSNTGADPNASGASGTVQATESTSEGTKRNSDKETLNIMAKGLVAATDYSINATLSGSSTAVGTATTDSKGNLKATFSTTGSKKNLGTPPSPLTAVSEVDVVNSNSVTVLVGDMKAPTTLKYTVRKNVTDASGASAGLTVATSTRRATFGMSASGLNAGADYLLRFNGSSTVEETNTASAKGTLKFINPLTTTNTVVTPFQLQSVELDDTNNTPVISTTIP
jgi:hypothetical protein